MHVVRTYIGCLFIVVNVVDISGQAEVSDLHDVTLCDQDVPGCQVSVDTLRDTQHVDNMSGSTTVLETDVNQAVKWF